MQVGAVIRGRATRLLFVETNFMIHPSVRMWGALLLTGLAAGCASRELPTRFPENSPASVEAHAGKQAQVTRALDADPGNAAQPAEAGDAPGAGGSSTGHEGHHDHAH